MNAIRKTLMAVTTLCLVLSPEVTAISPAMASTIASHTVVKNLGHGDPNGSGKGGNGSDGSSGPGVGGPGSSGPGSSGPGSGGPGSSGPGSGGPGVGGPGSGGPGSGGPGSGGPGSGGPGVGGPGVGGPGGGLANGPAGDKLNHWVSKGLLEAELSWIQNTFVARVQAAETTLNQNQSVTGSVYGNETVGTPTVPANVYGPNNPNGQTISFDITTLQSAVTKLSSDSTNNLWTDLQNLFGAIRQLQKDSHIGPVLHAPNVPGPTPPLPLNMIQVHEKAFAAAWDSLQKEALTLKDDSKPDVLHRVQRDVHKVLETGNWIIQKAQGNDQ